MTILAQVQPYLLTPWIRFLLEKLTSFQLVTKFSTFCGTQRFITAFTMTAIHTITENRLNTKHIFAILEALQWPNTLKRKFKKMQRGYHL